jgi:hypothetical protein
MRRVLLLCVLLLCLLPRLSGATTRYVQNGGSGGSNCSAGAISNPLNSIAAAISCSGPGDIVYIRQGSYLTEPLYNWRSGPGFTNFPRGTGWGPGQEILIASAPNEQATLQRGFNIQTTNSAGNGLAPQYMVFDRLIINGGGNPELNPEVPDSGAFFTAASHIKITNSDICCSNSPTIQPGGGVTDFHLLHNKIHDAYPSFNPDTWASCPHPGCILPNYCSYFSANHSVVDSNEWYNCSSYAWQAYVGEGGVSHNVFSNNIIHDVCLDISRFFEPGQTPFDCSGMVFSHGSDNLIYNNLIYNVGPFATSVMSLQNTNDQVYNNTIADSPKVGVLVQSASNLTLRNMIIRNTGDVPILQINDGGTIFSNNLCTAPRTGCTSVGNPNLASDFKLTTASTLAIDTGFALPGVVTVDQAGNARPVGAGWDLGAYEFGAPIVAAVCNPTWDPVNVLDGSSSTAWHTQFSGTIPNYPHDLQVNMHATYQVAGFRYLPRPGPDVSGRIVQYEFYTSLDGTNWGTAAAAGTWPNSAAEQEVVFAPRAAQYVWLRGLAGIGGQPVASVAELNVLQPGPGGTGTGTLSGTVTVPAVGGVATFTDLSITPGGTYTLQATTSGLTPAQSIPFTITAAPTHLRFGVQPTTVLPGQTLPAITVQFLDGADNVFSTTQVVTLVLAGCAGATLSGTVNQPAVAGTATFTDLSIATPATTCSLVASATGMVSATSQGFSVLTNPFVTGEWLADGVSAHYCAQTGGDTNLSGSTPGVDHVHTLGCALPAHLLQGGALLQSCAMIDVVTGGTGIRPLVKLALGGQTLAAHLLTGTNPSIISNEWVCFTSVVANNSGPAVPVYTSFDLEPPSFPQYASLPNQITQPVTVNTAVALPLSFVSQWPTAGSGSNSLTLHGMIVGLGH